MPQFRELLRYREELLAAWAAQPERLAAAWAALPEAQRARRGLGSPWAALAALWQWEAQVGFPNLQAMVVRQPLRAGAVLSPADFPPPETMLADYRRLRQRALRLVAPLDGRGWSFLSRHPRYGQRTVQWWVERSYALGAYTLQMLSPEEVSP